jgi:hypothetical protein
MSNTAQLADFESNRNSPSEETFRGGTYRADRSNLKGTTLQREKIHIRLTARANPSRSELTQPA